MAKVICLFLCLLFFSFVDCQFGLLANIGDNNGHVLRARRAVEVKVPSCPTVSNMPARCVDLNQCLRIYELVNTNRNNPKFENTLKQLQCGSEEGKNPRICCPVQWISKRPSTRTKRPRRQTPTMKPVTKPPVTERTLSDEETCKSLNSGILPGRCVSLLECPSLYKKAVERSQDPEVRNEMFRIHCGWVDNDPKICCPLESIAIPAPTQPSGELSQSNKPSQDTGDFVDTLPSPPVCGSNFGGTVTRVVGGSRARPKMFPWMALLGYRRRWKTEWLCGGSLISTRHVLTAAHCIHGNEKSLFQVRLGELVLATDLDDATPIDIPIKKQIIHEQFVAENNENDIGMLTLATEVRYTDYIKPICMPMTPDLRSNNFEGYRPFLAGWGQIKYGGRSANHLNYVQIPVTNTAFCSEIYKKDDENFKPLDNRSLCAGYKQGKRDSCSGDSGGPLMQPDINPETKKTTFYQTGIISYGKGCGAPEYPGIYVRVTEYIPWIVKQTTGKIVS